MKKEFILLALLGIILVFGSCKDKDDDVEIEEKVEGAIIYGTVIDKYSGEPLYNVLVKESKYGFGSGVTGKDGSYEFTVPADRNYIDDSRYYFVASKKNYYDSDPYRPRVYAGDNGRRIRVDFQLEGMVITYTGKVVDSQNKPIVGAKVSAKYNSAYVGGSAIGSTVISGSDGSYTLMLPKPDRKEQWLYYITASQDGYKETTDTLQQHYFAMGKVISLDFILYK